MKFNKSGQLLLVSAAALLVSGLLSACLVTNTADFVFVASSKAAGPNNYGIINVLEVNAQSGTLRPIPTSPFPSQGRNPVAEVTSPDHQYLYVVNHDDNTIVQFQIGSDGKLYAQSTINTPGIFPVALAMDPAEQFLYVIDTYEPLPICSPASPCPGSVAVFPILPGTPGNISTSPLASANGPCPNAPSGGLCTPIQQTSGLNYVPLNISTDIVTPFGATVLASGNNLYITAQDSTNGDGYIFNFTSANGVLTADIAQPIISTGAGSLPTAITNIGSSTLFVADSVNLALAPAGNILTYSIAADGSLTFAGAYTAGNTPVSLAIDPSGKYFYVANSVDGNLSAFTISGTALSSIGTYAAGSQPSAVFVDPNLGQYVYVTNFLGSNGVGTVSGFALNPSSGGLTNAVNTPFTSGALPTAMAGIPHKFN